MMTNDEIKSLRAATARRIAENNARREAAAKLVEARRSEIERIKSILPPPKPAPAKRPPMIIKANVKPDDLAAKPDNREIKPDNLRTAMPQKATQENSLNPTRICMECEYNRSCPNVAICCGGRINVAIRVPCPKEKWKI